MSTPAYEQMDEMMEFGMQLRHEGADARKACNPAAPIDSTSCGPITFSSASELAKKHGLVLSHMDKIRLTGLLKEITGDLQ